jgi:hypothetical protein
MPALDIEYSPIFADILCIYHQAGASITLVLPCLHFVGVRYILLGQLPDSIDAIPKSNV